MSRKIRVDTDDTTREELGNDVLLTMGAALVAVLFLVVFCTPLAYVLARSTDRVNKERAIRRRQFVERGLQCCPCLN